MRISTVLLALSLSFAASLPAKADLVIKGRASQALHCSAMLYMVSDELYQAGYLSRSDLDFAQRSAIQMLAYVPGTQDQKVKAMGQRFNRIVRSRTLPQLMAEFNETAPWCQRNFL
ncbi:MAG: hypothetical protein HC844_05200 [Tabrizicola sp.]|nr:hypothetical protein [Tabrizicola sp.]